MFVPRQYHEPEGSWMVDLIASNPMALAATNGSVAGGPFATHLPVIFDPDAPDDYADNLSGTRLLGHMNRANPHWKALKNGDPVLLVFTGPHGYVSPTVYATSPAAPTWDFTAVHVHGTVERIESTEATLDVIKSTVTALEGKFGANWDMSESVDYFHKIVPAVGAFRVTVSAAEGMFKLSQEQPAEVRDRVQCAFSERESGRYGELAALMGRLTG